MNVRSLCALAVVIALAPLTMLPASADVPRDPFYWLAQINKASAVMVVERGIVPKALGAKIADAVIKVTADGDKPGAERSHDYLVIEKGLIAAGGPDMTRIHSGRSRQDIGATVVRLVMRDDFLGAFENLTEARAAVLAMAAAHPNAIVPAYTWGVQAQPISFGHYLLAYNEALTRLADRMRQAYVRLNQSPLGAAALGTSSFPVDRPRLATLLGFDGVLENSLDANQISPVDSGAEIADIAASGALTIGMFVADVTAQYGQTKPWLLLGSGTGTSSIMPQKRNPTELNDVRGAASAVIGHAQTFLFVAHNLPAGMSDYKPFIDPNGSDEPVNVLREAADLFTNYATLVKTLVLNEPRALDEVDADYSTTTELADTLQRESNVPFRVGHHFASELVDYGRAHNLRSIDIPYSEAQRIYTEAAKSFQIADATLPLNEAAFRRSLTAQNMVASSKGLGGPQPAEVARMLTEANGRLESDRQWLATAQGKLDAAATKLDAAFAHLRN
jgi:argininosuccinate lyase